jgi:hypothetical protein
VHASFTPQLEPMLHCTKPPVCDIKARAVVLGDVAAINESS